MTEATTRNEAGVSAVVARTAHAMTAMGSAPYAPLVRFETKAEGSSVGSTWCS
jgi:hypothetical protein